MIAAHFEIQAIKGRLHQGAETMDHLRKAIAAVADTVSPKPVNYWTLTVKITLVLLGVVGILVAAGVAYGELRATVHGQGRQLGDVKDDVAEIRVQQTQTSEAVREIAEGQRQLTDSFKSSTESPSAASYGRKRRQGR